MNRFFNKKILANILSALIIGMFFVLPQTSKALDTPTNPPQSSLVLEEVVNQTSPPAGQIQSAALAKSDEESNKNSGSNWLIDLILGDLVSIENAILKFIGSVIQTITAFLLQLSGTLLNFVIEYTVVNMNYRVGQMQAIDITWSAFRDVANMFFIFILLYIAIGTILNLSSVNTKKMLVNVIITAVLLNFSLFFTKIMIDASNILALGFYNSIVGDHTITGLSGAFIEKMRLLGIYSFDFKLIQQLTPLNMVITQIGGAVLMLFATVIFFAIALFFAIRFIVLIFLMILSPLAFASMALPKDKYSSKWWDTLISQCLFPPAFMALIWVSYSIIDSVVPQTDKTLVDVFISGGSFDTLPTLFNFFIVISMLVFSLVVAKSFASAGAGSMMKWADGATKWAQGKVGRGAVRASQLNYLDRKFADSPFGKSRFGSAIRSMTTGKITSLDFGSGKSVQAVDKANKSIDEEYAKNVLEKTDKDYAKEMNRKRKERELPIQTKWLERNRNILRNHEAALASEETSLGQEIASGNAYSVTDLQRAKGEVAQMKQQIASGTLSPAQLATTNADISDRLAKISNTETRQTKIAEIRKKKEISETQIEIAQNRIEDIHNEVGPTGRKEKVGLAAARQSAIAQLENNTFGVPVLDKLSPKRAFSRIPEGTVRNLLKNMVPTRDTEAAAKTIRKASLKDSGNQSETAQLIKKLKKLSS